MVNVQELLAATPNAFDVNVPVPAPLAMPPHVLLTPLANVAPASMAFRSSENWTLVAAALDRFRIVNSRTALSPDTTGLLVKAFDSSSGSTRTCSSACAAGEETFAELTVDCTNDVMLS